MSLIREATKILTRSKGWYKTRSEFIKEHPKCQCCGSDKSLEVHHKQPFHEHPELELDKTNLITLCDGTLKCHIFIGHLGNYKSYNLGVEKDAEYFNMKIRNRP